MVRTAYFHNKEAPLPGNHHWIAKFDRVTSKVKKTYEELETRKLAFQALLAAARELARIRSKGEAYHKAAEAYSDVLVDINQALKDRKDSQSMSARERLNFLPWSEILKFVTIYCKSWEYLRRKQDGLNPMELRTLQDIILTLPLNPCGMRSELSKSVISTRPPTTTCDLEQTTHNSCLIGTKRGKHTARTLSICRSRSLQCAVGGRARQTLIFCLSRSLGSRITLQASHNKRLGPFAGSLVDTLCQASCYASPSALHSLKKSQQRPR